MVIYILICKTDNCINKDIPIEYETDATLFCCGPCGQEITDVKIVSQVAELDLPTAE